MDEWWEAEEKVDEIKHKLSDSLQVLFNIPVKLSYSEIGISPTDRIILCYMNCIIFTTVPFQLLAKKIVNSQKCIFLILLRELLWSRTKEGRKKR